MTENHIQVICPHCGKEMDIPYYCDGTYEIFHSYWYYDDGNSLSGGCEKTFYVAIVDGSMHVYKTKDDLFKVLEMLKGE